MAKRSRNQSPRVRPAARKKTERSRNRTPHPLIQKLRANIVPLILSCGLIVALGVIVALTYSTATASSFFKLGFVEVQGVSRASQTDIEKIVKSNAERTGVWNADLLEIKQKIERVTFVKDAAVSRELPNGIRVRVNERVPVAIVRLKSGDFLTDGEGTVLAPADPKEKVLPFAMIGWNEEKSEKAGKENLDRLKMYQKMIAEWKDYDLASRVKLVDLADMREPKATLEDSGLPITIMLGRENFGQQLSTGIKAIVGKGNMFEGVNLVGQNLVLVPRKQQ